MSSAPTDEGGKQAQAMGVLCVHDRDAVGVEVEAGESVVREHILHLRGRAEMGALHLLNSCLLLMPMLLWLLG